MPTYPDPPGSRFMYDQDGSLVLASPGQGSSATPYNVMSGVLTNDEETDGYDMGSQSNSSGSRTHQFCIVFPEQRAVTGLFTAMTRTGTTGTTATYSFSTDTTDGVDGTWSAPAAVVALANPSRAQVRNSIQTVNLADVKAIRFNMTFVYTASGTVSGIVSMLHVYGSVPVTANTDRLEFWEPVANSQLNKLGFDFGDLPQGEAAVRTFRLKNLSATKTANAVILTADNATGGTENDAMVNGTKFSLDGVTYTTSATVNAIAPGALTPVLYAKRTVLAADAAIPRWARIKATPTTFA